MATPGQPSSIEAKLVVLGAQGVGKTSLLQRFLQPSGVLSKPLSTVGASFVTKRVLDDQGGVLRLQLWDTAGQERFHSIARLYYRGAQCALLCYDVTSEKSYQDMQRWYAEVRKEADDDIVIQVVGTKVDLCQEDASRREVPFEKAVAWLAGEVSGKQLSSPEYSSLDSKRSSGLWMLSDDTSWDDCSELSAETGEGVDELFRVVARKLVEQRHKRDVATAKALLSPTSEHGDYFGANHTGSFRLGHGDRSNRRSWIGLPSALEGAMTPGLAKHVTSDTDEARKRGRCC